MIKPLDRMCYHNHTVINDKINEIIDVVNKLTRREDINLDMLKSRISPYDTNAINKGKRLLKRNQQ